MIDITAPYEYTVEQKVEGSLRLKRLALLFLYILYPAALIFVVGNGSAAIIAPLLAFIPLSLWIIIFLTWRYVKISYQYTVMSGKLAFVKHYGTRTHKTQCEIMLKDAKLIAPVGFREHDERLEIFAPEITYSALSSKNAPDRYYIAFENTEGKKCVLFFEATSKALEICKMYNPKTVVTKVRY
jgi:hypothetical protein